MLQGAACHSPRHRLCGGFLSTGHVCCIWRCAHTNNHFISRLHTLWGQVPSPQPSPDESCPFQEMAEKQVLKTPPEPITNIIQHGNSHCTRLLKR